MEIAEKNKCTPKCIKIGIYQFNQLPASCHLLHSTARISQIFCNPGICFTQVIVVIEYTTFPQFPITAYNPLMYFLVFYFLTYTSLMGTFSLPPWIYKHAFNYDHVILFETAEYMFFHSKTGCSVCVQDLISFPINSFAFSLTDAPLKVICHF